MTEHNTIYSKNYHNMEWRTVPVSAVHKTTGKTNKLEYQKHNGSMYVTLRAGAATYEGEMTSHDGAELQMRSGMGNRNNHTDVNGTVNYLQ